MTNAMNGNRSKILITQYIGSPIESTTYKFAKCLKNRFGEDVFKELDKSDANIPIYITCGNKDFLYELNLKFVDALKQKRVEYTWISEEGYEHEWRFWDLAIERFLDWIDRKDYYKNTNRKV